MSEESHEKKWVLVIEDEKDLRDLVVEQLSENGFGVLSCARVTEALRFLSNQRFNCILLDLRLENGNGSQVVSVIRKNKVNLNYSTPVVIVSGYLSVEVVQQIKDYVSGVFVKPFKIDALVEKVKDLCL